MYGALEVLGSVLLRLSFSSVLLTSDVVSGPQIRFRPGTKGRTEEGRTRRGVEGRRGDRNRKGQSSDSK